jgi:hypothetical protein
MVETQSKRSWQSYYMIPLSGSSGLEVDSHTEMRKQKDKVDRLKLVLDVSLRT